MTPKTKAKKKATKVQRAPKSPKARPVADQDAADFIIKADAVALLGVNVKTLERLASEGKLEKFTRLIPGRRGRRAVFYRRSAIDALRQAAPIQSTTSPKAVAPATVPAEGF